MGKKVNASAAFRAIAEVRARGENKTDAKYGMRTLLRSYYDIQAQRIIAAGRLKIKADGTLQEGAEEYIQSIPAPILETLQSTLAMLAEKEEETMNTITAWVETQPLYSDKVNGKTVLGWLGEVKGVGPALAAAIMTEFDIVKADNVSKLWAYAGLSPGMIHPTKLVEKVETHSAPDPETGEMKHTKVKVKVKVIDTSVLVRQDRLTAGYICPFNRFLKSKLIGVLAGSFLKVKGDHEDPDNAITLKYKKQYYDVKNRILTDPAQYKNFKGEETKMSDGWAHAKAARAAVKLFLQDLYVAWRTLEGLPVRAPYHEEYQGHRHGQMGVNINAMRGDDDAFLDDDAEHHGVNLE